MSWRSPLLAAAALAMTAAQVSAQCEPQWSSAFGAQSLNGAVRAIVRHDDGAGASVFVGGDFTAAGDLPTGHIARWDGRSWWTLDGGVDGSVVSMAVFDEDGPGPARPALFVAGEFTQAGGVAAAGLARWDGQAWSAVGGGVLGTVHVVAAATSPQHRGLYVGGALRSAGGIVAKDIARWDGTAWHALGAGLGGGAVHAITEFDLGNGPSIYAGGTFTRSGSTLARRVSRWNGSSWAEVAGGIADPSGRVLALAGFVSESGARSLHVGGEFEVLVNGSPHSHYITWHGGFNGWSAAAATPGPVHALVASAPGPTPQLYAVGADTHFPGVVSGFLFQASGPNRTGGDGPIFAVAPPPPDERYPVLLGGDFTQFGDVGGPFITQWSDTGEPVAVAHANGPEGHSRFIRALLPAEDAAGPSLYVCGTFRHVDGLPMGGIARWDGRNWSAIGTGVHGQVMDMIMYDHDGPGPDQPMLHALGLIFNATGQPLDGIARWDGSTWRTFGGGLRGSDSGAFASAAAVFDDGTGPALYVGGRFQTAGLQPAVNLARWRAGAWEPVGGGVEVYQPPLCFAVFDDDGPGPIQPALYVGGHFGTVGNPPLPARRIARWDGTSWSDVGGGVDELRTNITRVTCMAVFDPDNGGAAPASLYAGGYFNGAAGITSPAIVRWDGHAWHGVGGGLTPPPDAGGPIVNELIPRTEATGPVLYVAGTFGGAGGMPANNVARWDGQAWSVVGDGPPEGVSGAAFFAPAGEVPSLYTARSTLHRWGPDHPVPVEHPRSLALRSGARAHFAADVSSSAPMSIQWRRDGQPLTDGPDVIGATTPRLTLFSVRQSDQGLYDAIFTNACGQITTDAAALTVLCPADWDGDTALTSADIAAYLTAWLASVQAGNLAADFDGSGAVNSVDISAFLSDWLAAVAGGC